MEDKTNTKDIDEDTFEKLSKTEGIPKFSQICRVCLCKTNESDQQLNTRILFLNNSLEIGNLLEESTGVQIINLECLPNHICDKCLKTLTAWYRFRSRTQRSNDILKKYLKELSTSVDSKSLSSNDLTIHMQGHNLNVVSKQNVSEIQGFQVAFVKDTPEVVGFVLHCESCTMTFSNQIDLDKHQEEHINPAPKKFFKCLRCPKSFVFRNGLHSHMQLSHQHSKQYKFQCEVCERSFDSPARFKVHKSKPCVPVDLIRQCKTRKLDVCEVELVAIAEKTIAETKFSCILCKKNFKDRQDFIAHYPKHNKNRKCSICQKKLPTVKILERHVRMHLGARVYSCPLCSREFYTCQAFRLHVHEHGKKEWVYKCKLCQKEFFMDREFDKHMVQHLQDQEDEKKALQKEQSIGGIVDVVDIKNDSNIEIGSEYDLNIGSQDDSKNQLTNMETVIPNCQEHFQIIKLEEGYEEITPNQPENDMSSQIETDFPQDEIESKIQIQLLETGTPVHSTYQLDTDNNLSNANTAEVETEKCLLKDIKLENPELDNLSVEEENAPDETSADISNLSKSTEDQISATQSAEYMQKLLDKCRVNCHVAGCQTTFSNLNEMWDHFKITHLTGDKPYKCCSCSEILQHQKSLRFHIKKHYSFKCPVCSKLKITSSDLKKHIVLTHSIHRPHECTKCGKKFSRLGAFKVHESTHSNTKEFVCNICSKDFFSYNGLYLHLKSHKDIKELQCPICSRQFPSKHRLKRHVDLNTCVPNGKQIKLSLKAMEGENKDHEEVNENDLEDVAELIKNSKDMEIDDESYSNAVAENELTDIPTDQESTYPTACVLHIVGNNEFNTEVKTEIIVPEDIVKFENPDFDKFSIEDENGDETDNYYKIKDEMSEKDSAQYTQELLDKCKVDCHIAGCQTKLANLAEVWKHFKKEHLFGSLPFTCCICFEEFDNMNSLQVHIKRYYTFQCPVCYKLTANSCELRRHVKLTHTNEPPFKCEKCGKKFGKNCHLKKHETKHHEKKEFVCGICSKDFFSYSGLKKHKISHKDIKKLQCSICSRQFSSNYHLQRHININTCGQIGKL